MDAGRRRCRAVDLRIEDRETLVEWLTATPGDIEIGISGDTEALSDRDFGIAAHEVRHAIDNVHLGVNTLIGLNDDPPYLTRLRSEYLGATAHR